MLCPVAAAPARDKPRLNTSAHSWQHPATGRRYYVLSLPRPSPQRDAGAPDGAAAGPAAAGSSAPAAHVAAGGGGGGGGFQAPPGFVLRGEHRPCAPPSPRRSGWRHVGRQQQPGSSAPPRQPALQRVGSVLPCALTAAWAPMLPGGWRAEDRSGAAAAPGPLPRHGEVGGAAYTLQEARRAAKLARTGLRCLLCSLVLRPALVCGVFYAACCALTGTRSCRQDRVG